MVQVGSAFVVAAITFGATPLLLMLFARDRRPLGGALRRLWNIVQDYPIHLLGFVLLGWQKNAVDGLNDPLSSFTGDMTWLVHAIEGDAVYWIQSTFEAGWLTDVLNANYLFGYTLLIYISVFLFMWDDDRSLANKTTLNYILMYMLTVPFYLFFNVQVTSHYIPNMEALLYHWSDFYLAFFAGADPLDNAFPSLHIGIPMGAWFLIYREMKRRGEDPWAGRWGWHMKWLTAQIVISMFSIAYLGVHWLIDIPGGIAIAYVTTLLVEEFEHPILDRLYRWWGRLGGRDPADGTASAATRARFAPREAPAATAPAPVDEA